MSVDDAVDNEGVKRRRGCWCSKDDFLPEESFKSWGNYVKALKESPNRLKDRVVSRSNDQTELVEMRSRSENEMKKTLNWWDLMWLGMGSVIGAGIFVLTGVEAKESAGPAIILSYVISGLSALLSVFCYTEFAVEIPAAAAEEEEQQSKGFSTTTKTERALASPELDRSTTTKIESPRLNQCLSALLVSVSVPSAPSRSSPLPPPSFYWI